MGMLNRDTRKRLQELLSGLPIAATYDGRTLLLVDLPPALVDTLNRSQTKRIDLANIIGAADAWSFPALRIVIENAQSSVESSEVAGQPPTLLAEIEKGAGGSGVAPAPTLHQLRPPVADFVGREAEIAQLVESIGAAGARGAAAAISGIRGLGAIGKTELALVVAARLADRFPDAQLVLELRGASANPLPPEQALQTVIRAFAPQDQC